MKILILGNLNTVFTFEFVKMVLVKNGFDDVSVLNLSTYKETRSEINEYCIEHNINVKYLSSRKNSNFLMNKIIVLKNIFRLIIAKKYDIVHIHSIKFSYFLIGFFMKKKARLIVSYYGSDLLKHKNKLKWAVKILLRRANYITISTKHMIDIFRNEYGERFDKKIVKAMYGSEPSRILMNKIRMYSKNEAKECMGFPLDKKTIYCGYNGHRSQRHLDIIYELSKIKYLSKKKYHLVLHCSYGLEDDYHSLLKDALEKSGFTYSVITDFYVSSELALFRIACDIFINLQDTDALSATMIESLSSGAIVIIGNWLKYYEIDFIGAFYKSISSFSELSNVIYDIENNWSDYRTLSNSNDKLGEQLLSWDKLSNTWLNLYKL